MHTVYFSCCVERSLRDLLGSWVSGQRPAVAQVGVEKRFRAKGVGFWVERESLECWVLGLGFKFRVWGNSYPL